MVFSTPAPKVIPASAEASCMVTSRHGSRVPALALAVGEATALVLGEGLLVGELPHAALKTIATMAVKVRLLRRIPALQTAKDRTNSATLKQPKPRFAPYVRRFPS